MSANTTGTLAGTRKRPTCRRPYIAELPQFYARVYPDSCARLFTGLMPITFSRAEAVRLLAHVWPLVDRRHAAGIYARGVAAGRGLSSFLPQPEQQRWNYTRGVQP